MTTYVVTSAARDEDDTVTLGLDDVSGLAVGEHVHVYNVGNQIDGAHVLLSVDAGTDEVTFHDHGDTFAEVVVDGVLVDVITWIEPEDVEEYVGEVTGAEDVAYLETCCAAANEWAYDRRRAAGYRDNPTVIPGGRVRLGLILLAGQSFREKGSATGYATFDGMSLPPATNKRAEIMSYLGIGKARVS